MGQFDTRKFLGSGPPLVPLDIRQFLPQKCCRFSLDIGLGFFECLVNPAALVYPLVLLQIVERRVPSLWDAENEKSDVLMGGIEGSHRSSLIEILHQ